jgi:hypothetical protein
MHLNNRSLGATPNLGSSRPSNATLQVLAALT